VEGQDFGSVVLAGIGPNWALLLAGLNATRMVVWWFELI
tara:strand:- start:770 stop:886 length:117 start_codon:yes stop_codon:yes gene_type:complete